MIKVETFLDQDEARIQVARVCARFAHDALCLIDSATGPEGPEGMGDAPPELTAEYAAFRAWLGPELLSLAQSTVAGPIISGMSVDVEGRAQIAPERYADGKYLTAIDRTGARIRWLADEITSLTEAYGELYEDEIDKAFNDVEAALCLDLEKPEDRGSASLALDKLERWYIFAHPGARLLRNDEDAMAAARKAIAMSRQYLEERGIMAADIQNAIEDSKTETYVSKEATVEAIEERLAAILAHTSAIERKMAHLDDEREALLRRLAEIKSGTTA